MPPVVRQRSQWARRSLVAVLCVVGVVAMTPGADHLSGMTAFSQTSAAAPTATHHTHEGTTSSAHGDAAAGHTDAGSHHHGTHHHGSHLTVMCLLIVVTVAAVLRSRTGVEAWRMPASNSVTPLRWHREAAGGGVPPWTYDRLGILLR